MLEKLPHKSTIANKNLQGIKGTHITTIFGKPASEKRKNDGYFLLLLGYVL